MLVDRAAFEPAAFLNYALRSDVRRIWGLAVDAEDNVWVAGQGWNSIVEVIAASGGTNSAAVSTANSSVQTVTETKVNATPINVPEYPNAAATLALIMTGSL